jgi:hypothetical protein
MVYESLPAMRSLRQSQGVEYSAGGSVPSETWGFARLAEYPADSNWPTKRISLKLKPHRTFSRRFVSAMVSSTSNDSGNRDNPTLDPPAVPTMSRRCPVLLIYNLAATQRGGHLHEESL